MTWALEQMLSGVGCSCNPGNNPRGKKISSILSALVVSSQVEIHPDEASQQRNVLAGVINNWKYNSPQVADNHTIFLRLFLKDHHKTHSTESNDQNMQEEIHQTHRKKLQRRTGIIATTWGSGTLHRELFMVDILWLKTWERARKSCS